MNAQVSILAGGVHSILFAVFHVLFWRLFRWDTELARLGFVNRNIMQILNLCLTFVFVIFAYVSFAHTDELLTTGLGRSLMLLIAVFWFLRAAEQIWFFGLRRPLSAGLFVLFVIGGCLYAAPLL